MKLGQSLSSSDFPAGAHRGHGGARYRGVVNGLQSAACNGCGDMIFWDEALTRLRSLRETRDNTQRDIREAVASARRNGSSWAEIGDALGMSRQGAQQQFGE